MKNTDTDRLKFIQDNEASLTFASSEVVARKWRCHVYGRHFASPDRRERSERTGFGKTANQAIDACMKSSAIPNGCDGVVSISLNTIDGPTICSWNSTKKPGATH